MPGDSRRVSDRNCPGTAGAAWAGCSSGGSRRIPAGSPPTRRTRAAFAVHRPSEGRTRGAPARGRGRRSASSPRSEELGTGDNEGRTRRRGTHRRGAGPLARGGAPAFAVGTHLPTCVLFELPQAAVSRPGRDALPRGAPRGRPSTGLGPRRHRPRLEARVPPPRVPTRRERCGRDAATLPEVSDAAGQSPWYDRFAFTTSGTRPRRCSSVRRYRSSSCRRCSDTAIRS